MYANWSPDGSQLFFDHPDTGWIHVVDVSYEPELRLGDARRLFDATARTGPPRDDFHISPDGSRFLVMTDSNPGDDNERSQIHVVTRWDRILARQVPVGR